MHALVIAGAIAARKDFGSDSAPSLAANKGEWLPIVPRGTQPDHDNDTEICEPSDTIGQSEITEGWTVRNLTTAELNARKSAIKVEARARILAVYPDWKQTNMTARGVELVRIKAEGGSWSTGEAAEAAALDVAWTWIKSVRAASDALEITNPANFGADEHWPATS
jgi:hypothetical protein